MFGEAALGRDTGGNRRRGVAESNEEGITLSEELASPELTDRCP
jgi:hypothetical protein